MKPRFSSESKLHNRNSNCWIVHAEPTRGYGPCMEPVSAVGRPWRKQSSPVKIDHCELSANGPDSSELMPCPKYSKIGLRPYLWDLATVSASPGW